MKKVIVLGLTACLSTFYNVEVAQSSQGVSESNYFDFSSEFMASPAYTNPDTSEGGAFNQFQRLHEFWGRRLYPAGDFNEAKAAIEAYANQLHQH